MKNRVNLTWIILLVSFSACVLLSLTIPLGANAFVQQSTRRLFVWGRGTSGKPTTSLGGELLVPGGAPIRYRTPIGMDTGSGEVGVFEVTHPDNDMVLARVDVLSSASVEVSAATMPRFGRSAAVNQVTIGLSDGRIRLAIPPESNELIVYVNTPNGQAAIDRPGKYTVEYKNQSMQVSVFSGHAFLRADDNSDQLELQNDERGILGTDRRTAGPFATERNLIVNGDFNQRYKGWIVQAGTRENSDQPEVEDLIESVNGEPALRFSRDGIGNASKSVRQTVNQSVEDFVDMRLNVTMRIINQDLQVCGFQGTECPMTVRIAFIDTENQKRAWEQGFYVVGEIGENAPDVCQSCGFPLSLSIHQKLPQLDEVFPAIGESNLIAFLDQEGIRPAFIESVTLVAEGHSFAVDVIDVELVVSEEPLDDFSTEASVD